MRCAGPQRVDISFGVKGAEAGREIRLTVGGTEHWRRLAQGTCAVSLHDVRLPGGDSVLELEMSGPPVVIGRRLVGMRLYELRGGPLLVAAPAQGRGQPCSFSTPSLNRSS